MGCATSNVIMPIPPTSAPLAQPAHLRGPSAQHNVMGVEVKRVEPVPPNEIPDASTGTANGMSTKPMPGAHQPAVKSTLRVEVGSNIEVLNGVQQPPHPSPGGSGGIDLKHHIPAAGAVDKLTQQICLSSWKKILAGSPLAMKERLTESKKHGITSPAGLFYERFYHHLFTLDPAESKSFFAKSGIQRKSRSLLRMVSTCLSLLGEKKEHALLSETARKHGLEYGVSPDTYVHTLNALTAAVFELLGVEAAADVKNAWEQTKNYVLHHMLPAAFSNYRPVVVIVGAGYGGMTLARKLDMTNKFRVIVLERKKFFFHNLGGLRASIDPDWAKSVAIPYRGALKNGVFLHGDVTEIRPADGGVQMHGRDGLIIYKYLVIATGSSYAFPAKIAHSERRDLIANYRASADAAQKATNIVIIGGGAVGAELAGELADKFGTTKSITIVHRRPHIIFSTGDAALAKQAETMLAAMGVKLLLNDEIKLDADTAKAHAEQRQNVLTGNRTLTTTNGVTLQCDLLYVCAGTKTNSASYQTTMSEHIDHTNDKGAAGMNRLRVDSHLRVGSFPNVFAIGDCAATGDALMALSAMRHAEYVNDSIIALNAGKIPAPYEQETVKTMVLTLGSKHGVGVWKGHPVDEAKVIQMKAIDLSSTLVWGSFGFDFKTRDKLDWGDQSVGDEKSALTAPGHGAGATTPGSSGSGDHTPSSTGMSAADRMADDVKTLATTMHITEAEAAALLEEGLKVKPRATTESFT